MIEIQSLLGLTGYYRRFIEGFSTITSLLIKLTHKEVRFVWSCNNPTFSRPKSMDFFSLGSGCFSPYHFADL